MNRFKMLAAAFALLTVCLAYEGGLAGIHGFAELTGVGAPRYVMGGS